VTASCVRSFTGQYDEASKHYKNYRKDFYTSDEIVRMAKSLGALD
jgi:hypothetical protein